MMHRETPQKTDLLKFSLKTLLSPSYFMIGIVLFLRQSLWGDQWIIHLTKKLKY